MARPTKCTPELIEKAQHYLDHYDTEVYNSQSVPTIEGLALAVNLARSTVHKWATEEDKADFSDIVENILTKQAINLSQGGLLGDYNASIAKLMLTKHGYSDKVEQDVKGTQTVTHKGLTLEFIDSTTK